MFHPLMETTVLLLSLSGDVCEFGNQRYAGRGKYPSVKAFYLANGFTDYVALDVNTNKDAWIADLNYPVSLSVIRQFDLVTNNGTSEHLWNQHQVFTNAHNLCKVDGVMLHILPFTPWLNHGFFNYNPIVFRDLAAANGYTILRARIGNREGDEEPLDGHWAYREKRPTELEDRVRKLAQLNRGDLFCVFAFRKGSAAEFRMPIQGKYQQDIEDDALKRRYAT